MLLTNAYILELGNHKSTSIRTKVRSITTASTLVLCLIPIDNWTQFTSCNTRQFFLTDISLRARFRAAFSFAFSDKAEKGRRNVGFDCLVTAVWVASGSKELTDLHCTGFPDCCRGWSRFELLLALRGRWNWRKRRISLHLCTIVVVLSLSPLTGVDVAGIPASARHLQPIPSLFSISDGNESRSLTPTFFF